jgi:hypothetical protein
VRSFEKLDGDLAVPIATLGYLKHFHTNEREEENRENQQYS